jgi:hypothetical protein
VSDTAFTAADEDSDTDDAPKTRFPDLHGAIEAAISALGGAVLPKLNWSAPKVRIPPRDEDAIA